VTIPASKTRKPAYLPCASPSRARAHRSADETLTPPTFGAAMSELRRHGGLSRDELGQLLGIDHRSANPWARLAAISAREEEHLRQLLATLRLIDRGCASENRSLAAAPRGRRSVAL
jgi:hypothetical protein